MPPAGLHPMQPHTCGHSPPHPPTPPHSVAGTVWRPCARHLNLPGPCACAAGGGGRGRRSWCRSAAYAPSGAAAMAQEAVRWTDTSSIPFCVSPSFSPSCAFYALWSARQGCVRSCMADLIAAPCPGNPGCDGLRHATPGPSPSLSLLGDLSLRLDFPIAVYQRSVAMMETMCSLGTG